MRTSYKILISIGIIIVFSLVGAAIDGSERNTGSGSAPILVVAIASAAVMAVWKYKPAEKKKKA